MSESKEDIAYALCEMVGIIRPCDECGDEDINYSNDDDAHAVAFKILKADPDSINSFQNRKEMEKYITQALESVNEPDDCHHHEHFRDS